MKVIKKYFPIFLGIISFVVYLITLAPTIVQIDAGELATVEITLGIAHPTGYPLFSIIGYLFSLLPLSASKIWQMNLLAAIWCSASIIVFSYTLNLILNNIKKFNNIIPSVKTKQKKQQAIKNKNKQTSSHDIKKETAPVDNSLLIIISTIAGIMSLAFSKTFWFQSTSVEVYSMHIFLISLIILTLILAFINENQEKEKAKWLIFAFALALGFCNHMTTILILPSAFYLYFSKKKFSIQSIKEGLPTLIVFFLTLIVVYSYLPLRAATKPIMNWGNPLDLGRILRHISGKQYQVWLFSSQEAASKQLSYYISNIFSESPILLIGGFAGLIISFVNYRKIFYFFGLAFITTVLYSINYDIVDIDSYFLLSYIALGFFTAVCCYHLLNINQFFNSNKMVVIPVVIIIVFVQAMYIYPSVNQNNEYSFEDYGKSLIQSTDKNAVILSYQWDYFVSGAYYYQNVQNFRKDVTIIDKELLRRSWYFNQLETAHPGLTKKMQPELDTFIEALKPFETGNDYNSNLLESSYQGLMKRLIANSLKEGKAVYVGPELIEKEMQSGEFSLPDSCTIVPDVFLFKIVKGHDYVPCKDPVYNIRFSGVDNAYIQFIKNTVPSMLARRALYEKSFNKLDRMNLFLNKIKKDFPDYVLPVQLQTK